MQCVYTTPSLGFTAACLIASVSFVGNPSRSDLEPPTWTQAMALFLQSKCTTTGWCRVHLPDNTLLYSLASQWLGFMGYKTLLWLQTYIKRHSRTLQWFPAHCTLLNSTCYLEFKWKKGSICWIKAYLDISHCHMKLQSELWKLILAVYCLSSGYDWWLFFFSRQLAKYWLCDLPPTAALKNATID